jgi:hypothetical protein
VRGKWYCSYPELKECHDPAMLPVEEVRIDPVKVNNISLGKNIYTREQLEEFARFQDSQGTRKANLAETAEMAYSGRNEKGEWGLALSSAAQGSLIDIVGASFFPLYRVVGPMIFFLSLLLLVWGGLRLIITVLLRVIIIVRCKGCGIWVLTAFWGTLFQLAISPFSWVVAAMEGIGVREGQMMEMEATREPEEGEATRRSRSVEELRKRYSWWPSGLTKEGPSNPLPIASEEAEEAATPKLVRTTRL